MHVGVCYDSAFRDKIIVLYSLIKESKMNSSRIFSIVLIPFLVAGCGRQKDEKPSSKVLPQTVVSKPAKLNPKDDLKTGTAIEITDVMFEEEVLKSKLPVLVDFWAPWCGPCRAVAPVVDKIANKYKGNLKVVKLNLDENPKVATKLEIKKIPTLMFFKEGRKVSDLTGFYKKEEIVPFVEEIINPKK